eukprot:scaffold6201_cov137-Isochrysis_galbana.AAC.2
MGASLQCDSADFPAAVACLCAQLAGAANDPLLRLRGGLDDIETAYRQVPCACPNFTVVCVGSPGESCFFTLAGLPGQPFCGNLVICGALQRTLRHTLSQCGSVAIITIPPMRDGFPPPDRGELPTIGKRSRTGPE